MEKLLFTLGILFIFAACNLNTEEKTSVLVPDSKMLDSVEYIDSATQIAQQAQQLLLSTLMDKIAEVGYEGAVPFCHEQALPLTKSAISNPLTSIQRVSLKNRNPANEADDVDQEVLTQMEASSKSGDLSGPVFRSESNRYLVYVPIFLGMPVCLGCHGNPDVDIAPATRAAIAQKYPDDKAIGYTTGDFRGAWRISFIKNQ